MSEDSITQAVHQFKTSREFKSDRIGNIPVAVGKVGVGVCVHVHVCVCITSISGLIFAFFYSWTFLTNTLWKTFPVC